jgi:transcriptional regulator with XRE-family HTH domain
VKIYEKIHFMRQLQGWSQEEMADKLSMSVNGYAKIERGKQIYKYLGLNKSLKHLG